MCLAKDYSEKLLEIYNSINTEVRRLCAEVNTADLYDMDMLHIIENTNFNACDGFKLAKSIKENRTFRRQIKNELETMKQLKNNFIDKNMELLNITSEEIDMRNNILNSRVDHKIYVPRVIKVNPQEPKTIGKEFTDPVAMNSQRRKALTLPIPQIKTVYPIAAIHKKSKEEIEVLSKFNDNYYIVKRKSGNMEVMLKKNILNLECLLSAK